MKHLLLICLCLGAVTMSAATTQTPFEPTEAECLAFLYRDMSLPDSLDRSRAYYQRQVEATLEARRQMPWGRDVPQREWLHFVLPVRVNNEALDESRVELYRQLAPRVKDMTMREAALEVNHWCHERVTYRPSDGRTLSPLACIRTGWGRCGEESTLTVAAMRAVGIPARQVYTPRWAHTDDNHAWVEVWIDGQWHFLGACEPQPILDLAWFNAPASRGMLMATNVHGHYDGPEEVLEQRPLNTRINVTDNYAPVDTLVVKVIDTLGQAVEGAKVLMTLYNYAELYPLTTRVTDTRGEARITAGLGDLVIWAAKDGRWAMRPVTVGRSHQPEVLVLGLEMPAEQVIDMDLVPPRGGTQLPQATEEQTADNARRLAREDSIRGRYLATFYTPQSAALWAREHHADTAAMMRLLPQAHGNHEVITAFLEANALQMPKALALLEALTPKDLQDVTLDVLQDAMTAPEVDSELYAAYILNPRVALEQLTPWRAFMRDSVLAPLGIHDAEAWRQWVIDNIGVDKDYTLNPSHCVISPQGVWKARQGIDPQSRDVFFVTGVRALGQPARINSITSRVQWYDGQWADVPGLSQADNTQGQRPQGWVSLTFDPDTAPYSPKYYYHFTLARIDDGVPVTLGYDDGVEWTAFAQPQAVDAGQYMLMTGQRLADGSVLTRCRIFEVASGDTVTMPLEMRHSTEAPQVIGSFNSEGRYYDVKEQRERSFLDANGRGYFVVLLMAPNDEPSIHALNDLQAASEALGQRPERIFVLYRDAEQLQRAGLEAFTSLPNNVILGLDTDGAAAAAMQADLGLDPTQTPLLVVADTFNRVVLASQGYTIGLGERLAALLKQLQ